MATLAADTAIPDRRPRKGRAPISAHPAFPAVVALWFAALFGLGCMVLPLVLLENIVKTTGISSLVASAQPPLGTTARLLIAVSAAVVGGAFGYWLGRKVADMQAPEPEGRALFGDRGQSAPTPISAAEELGGDGLDTAPAGKKRRSLAIAEDDKPSDYMNYVPLPGGAPAASDPEAGDLSVTELADALELSELAQDDAAEDEHLADLKNAAITAETTDEAADEDDDEPLAFSAPSLQRSQAAHVPVETAATGEVVSPEPVAQTAERQEFTPQADDVAKAMEMPEIAPVDFSPPSFSARPEAVGMGQSLVFDTTPSRQSPDPEHTPVEQSPSESFAMPHEFTPDEASLEAATPSREIPQMAHSEDSASPHHAAEGDSLMQLAERLGGAIRNRKQRAAMAAPQGVSAAPTGAPGLAPAAPALGSEEIDPLAAGDVADAVASFFKKPEADPAQAPAPPAHALAPERAAPQAAMPEPFQQPVEVLNQVPLKEPAQEPAQQTDIPQAFAPPTASPAQAQQKQAPFAVPLSMDGDGDDEDEDDENFAASFSLPLSRAGSATSHEKQLFGTPPVAAEPQQPPAEPDAEDAQVESDSFGSLTAMSNPFTRKQEFVRVDEPEEEGTQASVSFPAREASPTPAPAQPERAAAQQDHAEVARPFDPPAGMKEAENPADREKSARELREALETLQRISGAA